MKSFSTILLFFAIVSSTVAFTVVNPQEINPTTAYALFTEKDGELHVLDSTGRKPSSSEVDQKDTDPKIVDVGGSHRWQFPYQIPPNALEHDNKSNTGWMLSLETRNFLGRNKKGQWSTDVPYGSFLLHGFALDAGDGTVYVIIDGQTVGPKGKKDTDGKTKWMIVETTQKRKRSFNLDERDMMIGSHPWNRIVQKRQFDELMK